MTDVNRFQRLDAIFRAARGLDEAAQSEFIDTACGDDAALRDEVRGLLRADESAGGALDRPAFGQTVDLAQFKPPADESLPPKIGKYRIVRRIGAGGMGAVYEAEQDDPRRRVALKVIRRGLVGARLLSRFRYEAQILGQLRHPGIAHIYEAGTADEDGAGEPYFAMELVTGSPITEYATTHQLRLRERLELIAMVCDALHHAHLKGVIHRDLKPANILVEEPPNETGTTMGSRSRPALGQPKILDFGVARATDSDLQTVTQQTDIGELVGTVPYMSPEQATGDPDDLDTRSDLYSVGVLAYELVSGRMPYAIRHQSIYEAVRVIREEEPSKLSVVSRSFRGDVETIILTALRKDKAHRYQSAASMAADIRRFLSDEPIVARPPSTWYQLRKFAKRNTALVSSAAVVFVMLIVALVVVSGALSTARVQRDEAERQAKVAEAINAFLNDDLLSAVDPTSLQDRDVSMREVLDLASQRIDGKFPGEPLVEAAVRKTIGTTYLNLTEATEARKHLARVVELERLHAARPTRRISSLSLLAQVMMDQGDFDAAAPVLDEATEVAEAHLPESSLTRLTALSNYGELRYRRRELEAAEDVYREVMELGRQHHPSDEITFNATSSVALILQRLGRFDESAAVYPDLIVQSSEIRGAEHPYTLTTRNNYGLLLSQQGQHDEAIAVLREILSIRLRTLGDDHTDTFVSKAILGRALRDAEQYVESESFLLEAHRQLNEKLGSEHDYVVVTIEMIALLYDAWDKPEMAARWRAKLPAGE